MRRTQTDDIFLEAYDCRAKILDLLNADTKSDLALILESVQKNVKQIQECIGDNRIRVHYQFLGSLVEACQNYMSWGRAIRNAEQESSRYQKAFKIHVKDAGKTIKDFDSDGYFQGIVDKFLKIDSPDEIQTAFDLLKNISLPLPVYLEGDRTMRIPSRRDANEKSKENKSSTVYMSFKIDNAALNNPHVVEPNQMMDLSIEVRVSNIPENAKELVVSPLADIAPDNFEMPEFRFKLTRGKMKYTHKHKMKINFQQSYDSVPIEFTYQAYFLPGDTNVNSIVNNVIRIRSDSFDPSMFCGYEQAQDALNKIRRQLDNEKGLTIDQKKNFLLLMNSLANIAGQALQNNDFPDKPLEEEFKKSLRQKLSSFPHIGSDVSRILGAIYNLIHTRLVVKRILFLEKRF